MRLSEETINDIRNSATLSEVIGHYIPLVKKGKGYTALCPFHDDHDPSLSISDDKQIYKCFVCGNGGNVFNFVMNFKKISFLESVKEVADIIGKPLDIEISAPIKKVDKNQKYYDLLNKYIEETNYLLTSTNAGSKAFEYLSNRGLDKEVINYFNLGYNPKDDFMYKYLSQNDFKDEDMITVGINRMSDKGMRDIFYNRILFPIHNIDGNPIAFTARDFEGNSDSKYINSSETLIYVKGDNLYNLNRAKDIAKKLNSLIIVEGTMDVIAYHRVGIENVVATLGTALSKNQLKLLKSITNNIILGFDGDKAGQSANMKHGEVLLNNEFNVEVVDNNTGLDPDEIVNKDKNVLKDITSRRLSYIDYAIKYYKNIYNLDNYQDRKMMNQKISVLIDKLKDQYDRDNYENTLYELTKIRKIETGISKKEYNIPRTNKQFHYTMDGLTKAEYSMLVMMSMSKQASDLYAKDLGYMLDPINQELAMIIIDEYRKKGECHFSRLLDEVKDDNIKNLISTIATIDSLPSEFDLDLFKASINKVKQELKKKKLEDLSKKIKSTEQIEPNKANEYLIEYQKIIRELGGKSNAKKEN